MAAASGEQPSACAGGVDGGSSQGSQSVLFVECEGDPLERVGVHIVQRIRSGTLTHVHMANYKDEIVAVKVAGLMPTTKPDQNGRKKQEHHIEVNILKNIRHEHIVKLKMAVECPEYLALVLEFCRREMFLELLSISRADADRYFIEIVKAVDYLHRNNIIHGDLKLENVLIDDQNRAKLCDFGHAKQLSPDSPYVGYWGGTKPYWGPEYKRKQMNPVDAYKMDCFALGVVKWSLLTRKDPETGMDFVSYLYRHHPEVRGRDRECVLRLLAPDPIDRATTDDALRILTDRRFELKRSHKSKQRRSTSGPGPASVREMDCDNGTSLACDERPSYLMERAGGEFEYNETSLVARGPQPAPIWGSKGNPGSISSRNETLQQHGEGSACLEEECTSAHRTERTQESNNVRPLATRVKSSEMSENEYSTMVKAEPQIQTLFTFRTESTLMDRAESSVVHKTDLPVLPVHRPEVPLPYRTDHKSSMMSVTESPLRPGHRSTTICDPEGTSAYKSEEQEPSLYCDEELSDDRPVPSCTRHNMEVADASSLFMSAVNLDGMVPMSARIKESSESEEDSEGDTW